MHDDLKKSLIAWGMSEKEASVYLTLLTLWSAPASTIARHIKENRTTIYATLQSMKQKGIIEEIKRKDIAYFAVVSPELLLKHIEEKTTIFKDAIPMLLSLTSKSWSKPIIHYREWTAWLQKLFEDFALTNVDMRVVLGTPIYYQELLIPYASVFRKAKEQNNIKSFHLMSDQDVNKNDIYAWDLKYNRETRFFSWIPFPIKTYISIYWPNKVSFIFFDNNSFAHIILIENQEVYETCFSLFSLLWNNAS